MAIRDTWHRTLMYFGLADDEDYEDDIEPYTEPEAEAQEVAEAIAEYNLLAIPVVDEHKRFLGAITVDDVLDRLLKESWRRGRSRSFGG